MVLTDLDYQQFHEKNTYLAAKLITLFVEHPIVFIGYSISDENISGLLKAICTCIGPNNIEQLRKNLIFVQRLSEHEKPNISDTYLTIEGIQIPLVLVKIDDFSPVYEAIDATKRKIPARVLRHCKEQLYELVKSSEPEKKICVVDIDEIESKDDIEFLVGVGVASKEQVGPAAIEAIDLFSDLLHNNKDYDPQQIVDNVLCRVCRNTPNIPTFKYLNAIGIDTKEKSDASSLNLNKVTGRDLKDFRSKSYAKAFFRTYRHKTLQEIIDECTPENASAYIPFLSKDKIDLDILLNFLKENESKLSYDNSSYASSYRKLLALYDKLKWGW